MKKLFTLLAAVLLTASVFAQSPEKMSYQAVIRNSSDVLVTDTQIGMQISILQGTADGAPVYVETQTPTTNANGLVSIEIGGGAGFSTINWSSDDYFIETKTAVVAPLTTYTITGVSQLLNVPYALHAKTAETVTGGITETDPVFTAWDKDYNDLINKPTAISDFTMNANTENITNLADPVNAQDAATKAYVDANAPATYEIGDLAHGGIVFYVEPCGTKGLVAATENQSTGIKWRGGSTNYATMARGDKVYAGKMNTSIIIAVHSAKDNFDNHAALLAANYKGGDFGDWYLPSTEELKLMHDNLHQQSLGGFANSWYWSSSELDASGAWTDNFGNGGTYFSGKGSIHYVRAVRAF